ncbi:hypothetical protein [Thalassobaculum sp.]|uniref:hypothetical protein n=1 Tax=Thalassobaculum sp. TaxID=2022740 RepID=UPI0032EDAD35
MSAAKEQAVPGTMVPDRHRIFEAGLDPVTVADLKEVVSKTLGLRGPLDEGQRDQRWWVNLADLLKSHGERPVGHVLHLLAASPMMAWCRAQMGDDLVAVLTYCIFRRFDPSRNPVPAQWHFDANIFGLHTPIVNLWIPLVDVGVDAPGITLVDAARRPASLWSRMIETADSNGRFDHVSRRGTLFPDADVSAAMAADPDVRFITPQIKTGGVIAFDHQYLHGTQVFQPGMGARDSFEFRVMPADIAKRTGLSRQFQVAVVPKAVG